MMRPVPTAAQFDPATVTREELVAIRLVAAIELAYANERPKPGRVSAMGALRAIYDWRTSGRSSQRFPDDAALFAATAGLR